jgi:hypothetical protein
MFSWASPFLCLLVIFSAFTVSAYDPGNNYPETYLKHNRVPQAVGLSESVQTELQHTPVFVPFGRLQALSESSFTTLSHPEFPAYKLRVKKSRFCDGTVQSAFLVRQ